MSELSPSAQAILNETLGRMCAGECDSYASSIAATVIRALADQVVPDEPVSSLVPGAPQSFAIQRRCSRHQILAIATELEAQP